MFPLMTVLEQHGLSPAEANVYLAALELGQAPASQIARKLGQNRVTVYSTLQNLIKKQLIFTVTKNKVIFYFALAPQKLLTLAKERVVNLEDAMGSLLAMTTKADQKPSVQMYEGIEGIKMCYEDTLNYPKSTMRGFLGYAEIQPQLKRRIYNRYLPKRIKNQIMAKILTSKKLSSEPYCPLSLNFKDYYRYTKFCFIQDPVFELYNEICLYAEDKIYMVMFRQEEMIGMIIKSRLLYNTLSALFDLTWKREKQDQE